MATNYWINIDRPTQSCHLHRSGCALAETRYSTPLKGVGELRGDGGWLEFESIREALGYFEQNCRQAGYGQLHKCVLCWRPIDWLTIASASLTERLDQGKKTIAYGSLSSGRTAGWALAWVVTSLENPSVSDGPFAPIIVSYGS